MKRFLYIAITLSAISLISAVCDDDTTVNNNPVSLAGEIIDPDTWKTIYNASFSTNQDTETIWCINSNVIPENTSVWELKNNWEDTETPEAHAPGMSWGEQSGLDWNRKYQLWIKEMTITSSQDGRYKTFALITPWGTVASPALEGTELAIFLRVAFASWYNLPFIIEAWHSTYQRIFYGHFGILYSRGQVPGTPGFKDLYSDYTGERKGKAQNEIIAQWPSDEVLKSKILTSQKDDVNSFPDGSSYSGAYFDKIFLNKRTGYFLLNLLGHFSSLHLSDPRNAYNIKPETMREGDILLERWQSNGIGHTMVVKNINSLEGGNKDVETVYGSMPRIQPQWYSPSRAKYYFASVYTGGPGENSDGDVYATFGGGLKRWRIARETAGNWYNRVPDSDTEIYIPSYDYESISARPEQFSKLLGEMTDTGARDAYLSRIAQTRIRLRLKPASCSSRRAREEAFSKLYELMQDSFGISKATVDSTYRTLADYVFTELEYNESKTCCWNSSTSDMYDIIMQYNRELLENNSTCTGPATFKMENGAYDVFKNYAETINRAEAWVDWSADESCSQSATHNDVESDHGMTDFCTWSNTEEPSQQEPGCGRITWDGTCDGNVVVWCDNNVLQSFECPESTTCSWHESYGYHWCF